jgi:hypothetical protein
MGLEWPYGNIERGHNLSGECMAAAALVLPTRITQTPSDYHRIIAPSLCIPSDSSIAIPVGLLACQRTIEYPRYPEPCLTVLFV